MVGHQTWEPQAEVLAERFDLLIPDLPGYGASAGPFSLDAAAAQVGSLLDGRDEVHLCGLSLGAMVALRVAALRGERVRSLMLSGVQVRVPRLLFGVQQVAMKLVPAAKFGAGDGEISKAVVLAVTRSMARADLRADLARVTARTLVLCGTKDWGNRGAARRAAAGIRGSELREVAGAGHVWNQELPELFNHTLSEWVSAAR